jgi:hypothetical protein
MKAYGGMDVQIHVFLTSALAGNDVTASRPSRFTPGERALSTYWIGGWMAPRNAPDGMEKRKFLPVPGLALQLLIGPTHSQSLYHHAFHSLQLDQCLKK